VHASFRECYGWVLGTAKLPSSGGGWCSVMRDVADAYRCYQRVSLFVTAGSSCWVGMGTSWLSVAAVVQDGDSILLLVVAMCLC